MFFSMQLVYQQLGVWAPGLFYALAYLRVLSPGAVTDALHLD
jgi:hypothetical protein